VQAPGGVFENGFDLLVRYAGEPFQELIHCRSTLDVLEQSMNGYACAVKHPRTAYDVRISLNRHASAPVQHD